MCFVSMMFDLETKQPRIFQSTDPPHALGLPVHAQEWFGVWSGVLQITHHTGRTAVPKGQEKFISALLLLASILRNYLLPTVPQVIVKLTHLEANKFSDINKLSEKWCYFWNFADFLEGCLYTSKPYKITEQLIITATLCSMIVLCI